MALFVQRLPKAGPSQPERMLDVFVGSAEVAPLIPTLGQHKKR
jgi:hypothetical protein